MRLLNPGSIDSDVFHVESIKSLFKETTRNGKHTLRSVFLILTPSVLHITERLKSQKNDEKLIKVPSLHLVDSLKVIVFKKSQRQTLKICFNDESKRYFELEETYGRKIVWTTWCKQVAELHYRNTRNKWLQNSPEQTISLDWNIINHKWKPQNFVWNDKYLYLGSKREHEDQSRPSPVPGLGRTEDIKLFYLKPQYFGCWDQSEHWVQCESIYKCNDR